ncbi:MAG: 4'-phosphopantetheinyl transferase family protein [Candidatus Omnitrophota bacterium]
MGDVTLYYFTLRMLVAGGFQHDTTEEEQQGLLKTRLAASYPSFLFHRGFLRRVLAEHSGHDPRSLLLTCNAYGKPYLSGKTQTIYFNLSHSGTRGLCVISHQYEVGVDMEAVRPCPDAVIEEIVESCFTDRERKQWACLDAGPRLDLFFRYWVRKEAVVKALGLGLSCSLDRIDVSDISSPLFFGRSAGVEDASLIVRDLPAAAPWIAALGVKQRRRQENSFEELDDLRIHLGSVSGRWGGSPCPKRTASLLSPSEGEREERFVG